jgi:hypothetical protein
MKTLRLLSAVLGLTAACALRAETAKADVRTDVIFDHPEKFADIRDMNMPTDKGQADILNRIRDHLVRETAPMVPEGYKLTITFTDIHLAGNYEPWRGPQWDEIRIIKDIYPPAFKFTYTVTDPSGKVVRKGSEDIRDLDFQNRLSVNRDDPLHYEKDILSEWARGSLKDLAKG